MSEMGEFHIAGVCRAVKSGLGCGSVRERERG